MADQEQLYDDTNIGKVVDRILEQEMRESYLDYAMSVIVSRALPDVRDGLKPVHRRVLYAMNEMGLRHTVKFRKSAAVVGEVMSKYHPHGDMAIYDTLVRLAQDFAMRYRLVQGQGNFGCFTKDTKIKLTDGRDLSFEDLVKEYKRGKINYTYTVNNLGLISMAEIKNPRLTIKQAELVKVILDNGEEIRCTPNHLFMLKEGKYKEAQFLISGESLMPLYQKISEKTDRLNRKGYVLIYQSKKDEWVPSHHLADNYNLTNWKYKKSTGRVRHHIDFNRFNNNPDNIKRMQWGEHWKIHYQNALSLHQSEDYRQKISEGRRIYWDNPVNRERYSQRLSERNLQNWKDESYREKMRVILSEVNKKYIQEHPEKRQEFSALATKTLKRLWQNAEYRAFMHEKIIKGNKNHITNKTGKSKFLKVCQELLNKKLIISEENYNEFRNLVYPYGHATSWQIGLSEYFQNNPELVYQEINKNHKVVKVEKLSYSEDVYDLTIDHSHNFCLAAGVFVHNSVDGDNAAAPRYTEARMTSLAEELLMDIDKDTVEFMDNYDGTRKEPKVLPAKVPQLLLNGTMGIAVGMATSIPPHNLGELTDAIIALIDNPETTIEELMVHMPGPDFPTGGVIYNPEEIKEAYMTGKGRVIMRAVAEIEDSKRGYRIIISELPYQVNKAELVAKIAELVKTKKIVGISDLRDESDKDGVRVVIELKSDSYPKKVLNQLFKLTPMQSSFHVNTLALVNGLQPKVLNLKAVLEYFIAHRVEVVTNRTKFELLKAQERAHILEGLKIALDNLDAVITTIRKSDTKEEAHANLTKKFNLSDVQASAILEMRLSALAGLERKRVEDEYKEKQVLIKELKSILADPKRVLGIVKTESLDIKAKYGDKRRTKIMGQTLGKFNEKDLVPNEEVVITLTKSGYIKRQPSASYRSQHRGGKGIIGMTTKDEDQIDIIQATKNHDDILFFTNRGRVFRQKVYEVPQSSRIAKGTAIVNVIQLAPEEVVTSILTMPSYKPGDNFVMITRQGVIKKTMADKYANIRASGLIAIKLDAGDELKWVKKSHKGDTVVIITHEGQSIHFPETDARLLGRSTRGVRGIKLRTNDVVISADVAHPDLEYACLVLAEKGLGKRTNLNQYTLQRRGGVGVKTMHLTERTGKIIAGELVEKGLKADLIITSKQGQVIRTPLNTVPMLGRVTQGVTLMRLKGGDKTANFSIIVKDDTVEGEDAGAELDTTESKQPKLPGAVTDASDKKVAPDKSSKTFIKRAISVSGLKERTSKLAKKSKGFVKKSITPLTKESPATSRLSKKRKK